MTSPKLSAPTQILQRSAERAYFDHDWLTTYHSFSFAEYVDPDNLNWGALRVFNDDTIAGGKGFPQHPHRDMEIITYVLDGALEHRDSMGNHGVVMAGGVQFMSAGTGVRHSEYNASASESLHLVQMWILPGTLGGAPAYGQSDFSIDDRHNRWLDVASGRESVKAAISLTQDASFHVARLESGELMHHFDAGRYGFLFVANGEIQANNTSLRAGDALKLYDVAELRVQGRGEVVLWDVPDVVESPLDA